MIIVTGSFRLPVERIAQARRAMEMVIAASREEPGCLAYAYAEDMLEPGLIRVSEAWVSGDLLAQHLETSHMKQWQEQRQELGMTDRAMTMHAVKNSAEM